MDSYKNQSASILVISIFILVISSSYLGCQSVSSESENTQKQLLEVNPPSTSEDNQIIAITGATLVDGLGGNPINHSVVIVKDNKIIAAGSRDNIDIPADADHYNAEGKTIMPGLIDAHYHSANDNESLKTILGNGVTTLRDPGHPISFYQSLDFAEQPLPRTYLTGAHLGGFPPVYKQQAVVVKSAEHARQTVHEHVENGATGIKTYFNLPLEYYPAVTEAASVNNIPVTAHLELVDADKVIETGVQGIEHVSSFGTALANAEESEVFKTAVTEDFNNRREGRFKLWASIDLDSKKVQEVLAVAAENNVTMTPTLAVFERKIEDNDVKYFHVKGYQNMARFVKMAHEAGVNIVTGSHRSVRYGDRGLAYQHEMEVLVEAGLSPMEVIVNSTLNNARFFRSEKRIGSVEPGKLADLLLINGDPTTDIKNMYNIDRVMFNGEWIKANN